MTGGNTGIGAAICPAAGRAGANAVDDYMCNDAAAHEVGEQVRQAGGNAIAVKTDVLRPAEVKKLVTTAVGAFGRIDVVVNNAGIVTGKNILDSDEGDFNAVIGTNLKGPYFGCKYAAEQFIVQGCTAADPGVVINISSVHEFWPMPGNNAYCVAKGGCGCWPETPVWNSVVSGCGWSILPRVLVIPPSTSRLRQTR
ncbi:SDR family NAD(P)-dependent oxidoreductase [Corynebacterium sp. CCM 8862]|uniref:SDR family NAD(P)-dependent oxidoreductase n=1 Tax=Corynebacterium mendelii TaxID=2765362 RepID=A0A939IV39_9CORY|nr:SDR family NAD(P)-dependent oxidoreductase [Corynebacterium mendelii]